MEATSPQRSFCVLQPAGQLKARGVLRVERHAVFAPRLLPMCPLLLSLFQNRSTSWATTSLFIHGTRGKTKGKAQGCCGTRRSWCHMDGAWTHPSAGPVLVTPACPHRLCHPTRSLVQASPPPGLHMSPRHPQQHFAPTFFSVSAPPSHCGQCDHPPNQIKTT